MKNNKGLFDEEVKKSRSIHGDNSLVREKKKSFIRRFFENLGDPIIRILLIALGVQIIFTIGEINYIEIIGIAAAILISTTVSTVSEYRSERAFEKLQGDAMGECSVLRGGKIKKIPIDDIVVGDILYLSAGERVPADATVISGKISVDQSALNGEGKETRKLPGDDFGWELSSKHKIFRGSLITDGSCSAEVGRVGVGTFYGMVARDVQAETRESPLKLRLTRLATQISKIGYVIAGLVGFFYLFSAFVVDNSFDITAIISSIRDYKSTFSTLIRALTLMITVVVVAAPEGLPMMITVVLSANMKKMLSDNILVKKLVGIETAGSMNILFTDKTGTITRGKPECERIITSSGSHRTLAALKKTGKIYDALLLSAKYNTDVAEISGDITGGNSTDRAIYSFFRGERAPTVSVSSKVPFTSEKKYSSVTLSSGVYLIKGAPEYIISSSRRALSESGETVPLDSAKIYKEYYDAANRGERVIAVASASDAEEENFTFIALIVMKDKVRPGASEAIKSCIRAGIQVVMVTGDGKETASAIAEECGIMNKGAGHIAIGCDELRAMSDDEIKAILPRIRVIARALPQDKTRLVRLSGELDLVVGMTGDGINDAPSLKLADIGFSMGSGTDIAKSASDIVILDDSFTAISKTVLYGRTIFKSIRKFITFQLIMNLAASGVSLVGQFIGIDTPITIIQMLWVNIIMDTLGGLAFAGEPALDYYMKEKPKRRDEPILTKEMLKNIVITGSFTLALCTLFLSSNVFRGAFGFYSTPDRFYTAFYALFIFAGIFNCFSARSDRLWLLSNIGKNRLFILIMLAISAIQIAMIYFGGAAFRCTPLEWRELVSVICLALNVVPFDVARRIIVKLS